MVWVWSMIAPERAANASARSAAECDVMITAAVISWKATGTEMSSSPLVKIERPRAPRPGGGSVTSATPHASEEDYHQKVWRRGTSALQRLHGEAVSREISSGNPAQRLRLRRIGAIAAGEGVRTVRAPHTAVLQAVVSGRPRIHTLGTCAVPLACPEPCPDAASRQPRAAVLSQPFSVESLMYSTAHAHDVVLSYRSAHELLTTLNGYSTLLASRWGSWPLSPFSGPCTVTTTPHDFGRYAASDAMSAMGTSGRCAEQGPLEFHHVVSFHDSAA
jgi:hypothetical protein